MVAAVAAVQDDDDNVLSIYPTAVFSVLGRFHEKHKHDLIINSRNNRHNKNNKKKRKLLNIFLDINEVYTRQMIQTAFASWNQHHQHQQQIQFRIVVGPGTGMEAVTCPIDCDFQWSEYERIDWDNVLQQQEQGQEGQRQRKQHIGASSYCIRKGLCRKAQLAHFVHRHVCKYPHCILKTSIPQTFIIDTWPVWEDGNSINSGHEEGLADVIVSMTTMTSSSSDGGGSSSSNRRHRLDTCLAHVERVMDDALQRFNEQQQDNENDNDMDSTLFPVWILKPSTVNKGAGIQIVHLYEQVVDICWDESDIREWVLQQYITPPLLLNGRKFHIRAYVLCEDALRVYLCKDCLALCAGSPYKCDDTSNLMAHITNTCYQQVDPNFNEDSCVLLWNSIDVATILVQNGTCTNSHQATKCMEKVINDMEHITAEVFRAFENEFAVFQPIPGCFEHYGLDFIIDASWNVYLLEVNPGPDFKQTGTRLQTVIQNLMSATIDVALVQREDDDEDDEVDHDDCHVYCPSNLSLVYSKKQNAMMNKRGGNLKMNIKLS